MHKTAFLLLIILYLSFFSYDLFAEEREKLMYWENEDIILSATKLIQHLEEAPSIAAVISDQEIRNMGARDLLDILKRVPGMGVSIVTGYGKFGVESRGIISTTSERVLLMIDGHRVNEAIRGTGVWHFGDMTVENIKRVEVVRGPLFALHGANAFAAMIHVITKDAKDIDGVDARVGSGSFDMRHYNILAGRKKSDRSKLEISGMVDYFDTEGAELQVDKDAAGNSGKTLYQIDKRDASLKMTYGDLTFNSRYLERDVKGGFVGPLNVLSDKSTEEVKHFLGDLIYTLSLPKKFDLKLRGYFDQFEWFSFVEVLPEDVSTTLPDGMIGTPEVKNRTTGLEAQFDLSIGEKNTLTAGAVYEKIEQFDVKHSLNFNPLTGDPLGSLQDVSSRVNWNRDVNRYISAFYLQHIWKITHQVETTLGIRHDRYSDFGETTNPRLGVVWRYSTNSIAKFLYGEAFRAPSFVELYNENNPVQRGNADLDPEKIKTFEVSLEHGFFEKYQTRLTYFHSEIDDLIRERKPDWRYENLDETLVDGIEAEGALYFNKSSNIYLNYTYQDGRDKNTHDRLPDVASHKGNFGFNASLGRFINLNANLLAVGPRPRDSRDSRDRVDGYEVVDLTLIVKNFFKNLEIRGSVYNLFDESYADPEKYTDPSQRLLPGIPLDLLENDYPREGRSFILEARYLF